MTSWLILNTMCIRLVIRLGTELERTKLTTARLVGCCFQPPHSLGLGITTSPVTIPPVTCDVQKPMTLWTPATLHLLGGFQPHHNHHPVRDIQEEKNANFTNRSRDFCSSRNGDWINRNGDVCKYDDWIRPIKMQTSQPRTVLFLMKRLDQIGKTDWFNQHPHPLRGWLKAKWSMIPWSCRDHAGNLSHGLQHVSKNSTNELQFWADDFGLETLPSDGGTLLPKGHD